MTEKATALKEVGERVRRRGQSFCKEDPVMKTAMLCYLLAILAMNVVPVSWILACTWIFLRDRAYESA